MAEIQDISRETFDTEVLRNQNPVLVYYYAPWCRPCREMEATVQAVADEVQDRLRIVQVNTDRQGEIVAQQKIYTIPSFQLLRQGKAAGLFRGPLTKLQMLAKLSELVVDNAPEEPAAQPEPSPAEVKPARKIDV